MERLSIIVEDLEWYASRETKVMRCFIRSVVGGVLIATLAVGEERERLLVVHVGDGTVAFVDPVSGVQESVVRVGAGPHEVALSKDGKTAVVANYGNEHAGSSLSVIDVASGRLTRTIMLTRQGPGQGAATVTYHRPNGICFMRDQRKVVVTCETENVLLLVDVVEGRVVTAIDTQQEFSHSVLLSRDGRKAFVANRTSGSLSVIDLNRRRVVKIIETGGGAQGMALHPTKDQLWVANIETNSISVIDTNELEEIHEFPCGSYPVSMAFTPDGRRLLCVNYQSGSVSVFDTETYRVIKEIDFMKVVGAAAKERPLEPAQRRFGRSALPIGIALRPDGRTAFVTCSRCDHVAEIDLERWKITRTFEVGSQPEGLAWSSFEDDITSAK